jgi:MFS family permease
VKRVLALPAFRLLAVGTGTSLLGDQFALVAMPWLALRLTGDPLALGIVLALEGVPRAAFMLVGGAITDRFSPRAIMIASDVVRFALTGLLAAIVFAGAAQTWMLYAFALAFGLVAGFAVPAANSIVPTLVEERDLQAGNSVVMGLGQLVGFLGPTLAGIVIGAYARSFAGIGLAFAIDAVSFAVSATCLALIGSAARSLEDGAEEAQGMWASILSGVRYLWSDRPLRLVVLLLAAVNLLLIGPLLVGIPVLADQRLPQGALAFGLLMSAYSGGNLVGFVLAGSLPRIGGAAMRVLLIGLLAAFGLVVGALGFLGSTWIDFGLLLVLGVGNGYAAILLFTWVQARTPKAMLGRMMSILMLTNTGLVPVSQALSGAVAKWDLTALFAGAGALELLVAVGAAFRPEIRTFSESLVGGSVREGAPDAGPRGEPAPADQAPADQAPADPTAADPTAAPAATPGTAMPGTAMP